LRRTPLSSFETGNVMDTEKVFHEAFNMVKAEGKAE
jgi:hypothetical protein